ncbi:transglycosylase SLT domain-containing protein [Amycolatopsis ultiminotia]|uniref:Transglycosylase SLT domain-containing protein n=1 Tax=Amycolatopsis ultiminotia TaxID=543629 RepID=A0ABP6WWR7_9PSEU
MPLTANGAGTPDNWQAFTEKVDKVAKLNVDAINKAADQFRGASTDAADHSTALDNTTKALDGGVWSGQAADSFFDYVRSVRNAGAKVEAHLGDVANDLSALAKDLGDIKSKVTNDKLHGAEAAVNARNQKAQTDMDAATNAAKTLAAQNKPGPDKSADQIKAEAKTDINKITSDWDGQVQGLLDQANGMIGRSQTLMKKQIDGGYDKVKTPGSGGTTPQGTGGIHTGHGGGGSGGGGGGGGGLGSSGGPPSSPPPGNVQQWIQEAIKELQAAGVNVTDADVKNIWAIIQHESGGNPNAINNWDSNAAAGHPSKGLMQCIDSTFQGHKLPGHDNIYNPVDNIIAGVRYSIDRYGSIGNVPGIQAMSQGGAYRGY